MQNVRSLTIEVGDLLEAFFWLEEKCAEIVIQRGDGWERNRLNEG